MGNPHVLDDLDAYVDDELSAGDAVVVSEHLIECPTCSESYEALIALRVRIHEGGLRMKAPAQLHATVREALRRELEAAPPSAIVPVQTRRKWSATGLSVAVAAGLVLLGAGVASVARSARAASAATMDAVLASHIHSLLASHLTDVLSTDQHTVKPWFAGRLDFSPTVSNFDQQGFPLTGGRLDYISGQPVAALVYRRRAHVINEFVWPASGGSAQGLDEHAERGYTLFHWRADGMEHWVVSDVSVPDLKAFVALVQGADSAAGASR